MAGLAFTVSAGSSGGATSGSSPRPFRIAVPESDLADLRDRVTRVRWATEPRDAGDSYGVALRSVQDLAAYWADRYDWRAWEARLNEYPQFTTTIDGTDVHFLHVRSAEPEAVPLILSHGWPGSVVEYLDVLGPLSDPRRHGLDPAMAFHLVIPSLPGSGWSGPTPGTGWGPRRIAAAWASLMRELGYQRYGAVGNDWGSYIAPEIGRVASGSVIGVHVTQIPSLPDGESAFYPPAADPADVADWDPMEQGYLQGLRFFQRHHGAYQHVQAQQPQTLAYALTDSPVGLLAWCCQVMGDLDPETLLTHVSIQWLTGTAGSALRIYAEHERQDRAAGPTIVPLGLAQFQRDAHAIRAYAERDHANIVSWNSYDRGGHYAAHQEPGLLVNDIRGFFSALRRAR
jgi:epoxide hydrolase